VDKSFGLGEAVERDSRMVAQVDHGIALNSMASNTGSSSELEMTFSTSDVAVCCSS
jgi:hypothetical protein